MVGGVLTVFIAVIVGLAIFNGGITSNVASVTNVYTYNTTSGDAALSAATKGTHTTLEGKVITNFLAVNRTGNTTAGAQIVIAAGNYTLINNKILVGTGTLGAVINLTGDASNVFSGTAGNAWNISYTYQPLGYVDSAGGRSLASLIVVFAALAIAVSVFGAIGIRKLLDL